MHHQAAKVNHGATDEPQPSRSNRIAKHLLLIIVWHLPADPTKRFHEFGADYHTTRINKGRKIRNPVRQLEALGQAVTLQPAA